MNSPRKVEVLESVGLPFASNMHDTLGLRLSTMQQPWEGSFDLRQSHRFFPLGFLVASVPFPGKESACQCGKHKGQSWLGEALEEGMATYDLTCLENPRTEAGGLQPIGSQRVGA